MTDNYYKLKMAWKQILTEGASNQHPEGYDGIDVSSNQQPEWSNDLFEAVNKLLMEAEHPIVKRFEDLFKTIHNIKTPNEMERFIDELFQIDLDMFNTFGDDVHFGNHFIGMWDFIIRKHREFEKKLPNDTKDKMKQMIRRSGEGLEQRTQELMKKSQQQIEHFMFHIGSIMGRFLTTHVMKYLLTFIKSDEMLKHFLKNVNNGTRQNHSDIQIINAETLPFPITIREEHAIFANIGDIGSILGYHAGDFLESGKIDDIMPSNYKKTSSFSLEILQGITKPDQGWFEKNKESIRRSLYNGMVYGRTGKKPS